MLGRAGVDELKQLEAGWRLIEAIKTAFIRLINYARQDVVGLGLLLLAGATLIYGVWIEVSTYRWRQADGLMIIPKQVQLDISGAVKRPGVYTLNQGQRVWEAIQLAGGLDERADLYWVDSSLNKARLVVDGEKIYIPFQSPAGQAAYVSLNRASLKQLDDLPGIGPKTARRIIDNRPYARVGELVERQIVSRRVWNKIKHLISL